MKTAMKVPIKLSVNLRSTIIVLVCTSLALGPQMHAAFAQPRSTSPEGKPSGPHDSLGFAIHDVALDNSGLLTGQVINSQGASQAGAKVWLAQPGKVYTTVQADDRGWFAIQGVRGGVYQIMTSNGGGVFRVWAPGSAPPAAQPHALVVSHDTVVRGEDGAWSRQGTLYRGQGMGDMFRNIITNPWVWAIGIAAAVAIPLLLDDDDEPARRTAS